MPDKNYSYHWISFSSGKFFAAEGSYYDADRPKPSIKDHKFDDLFDAVDYCVRNYVGRGIEISNKARSMAGLKTKRQ